MSILSYNLQVTSGCNADGRRVFIRHGYVVVGGSMGDRSSDDMRATVREFIRHVWPGFVRSEQYSLSADKTRIDFHVKDEELSVSPTYTVTGTDHGQLINIKDGQIVAEKYPVTLPGTLPNPFYPRGEG